MSSGFCCYRFHRRRPEHRRGYHHIASSSASCMETANEYKKKDRRYLLDQCRIFVSSPELRSQQQLTSDSASITSIIRLKYVVKYSNSFDSTWDNVDVIKWSLIELLSACICGNLLPLRPLIEKVMPPFRSIYSWYSDRKSSRKSSEKTPTDHHSFGVFRHFGASTKPKFISTLDFPRVTLMPDSKLGQTWRDSTDPSQINVLPPSTPSPAYFEKSAATFKENYAEEVPHGMIRKTSTTVLRSHQSESTHMSSQITASSMERPSRDGSERGLMPPMREHEHRISGPWSRAFALLDRH